MLPTTEEEKEHVIEYYLSQSRDAQVAFLQKVYSEAILGHKHDTWDVHASDGRWWVITNPTNLYSQEQFPNMDLAVTFHMGLCLRIPRTHEQTRIPVRNIRPFGEIAAGIEEIADALTQAHTVRDYQGIGVRCRETLLAFVAAAQDAAEWTTSEKPKRADFRNWIEVICNTALGGGSQKERRHLFKSSLNDAWVFSNWLTHTQSATWHDAEAAHTTVAHVLGMAMSLVIRHTPSVPEECPNCGSPNLSPETGYHTSAPEIEWERPVCDDCGWAGAGVPVGAKEMSEEDELFSRTGKDANNECGNLGLPLTGLQRPGDKVH